MKFLFLIFSLCTFSFTWGQSGVWTWVKGSNEFYTLPVFGEMGVPSPLNTPAGCYESVAWTGQDGNFYLFGGHGSIEAQNDLWKYNPETNEWTWVKGSGVSNHPGHYGEQGVPSPENLPPARWLGAFDWVDLDGNLWLYGGANFENGGTNFNDLWKYDVDTNMWTWVNGSNVPSQSPVHGTKGVPSPNNHPGWRAECAASWVDNSNNLWLFGGQSSGYEVYNDLWKYDISTNEWVWMSGSDQPGSSGHYGTQGVSSPLNEPSARISYAAWTDSEGKFWMFGGSITVGPNDLLSDLWKYDPSSNEWTWMKGPNTLDDPGHFGVKCFASPANNPSARMENRSNWIDNDALYMFGGQHSAPVGPKKKLNDLWVYNIESNMWTWISGDSEGNQPGEFGEMGVPDENNKPLGRTGAEAWYNNDGAAYIFGGALYNPMSPLSSPRMNDLWRFDIDRDCVGGTVGIEEMNNDSDFIVYPNPADELLNIDFSFLTKESTSLHIYNSNGQLVIQTLIPSGSSHWQIDPSKWPQGLYHLTIITKRGLRETRKFTLNR